jgi:hypothetical protein
MARYLRIAAAVVFALLAMAFVAWWVRSHFYLDAASGPIGKWYIFPSAIRGTVQLTYADSAIFVQLEKKWRFSSTPLNSMQPFSDYSKHTTFGFGVRRRSQDVSLFFPIWSLAALSLALAALFAFKRTWRFTTRGLLIATTAIAAILGLIVYSL